MTRTDSTDNSDALQSLNSGPSSATSPKKRQRSGGKRSTGQQKTRSRKPPIASSAADSTETKKPASTTAELGPNGYPLVSLSQLAEHCEVDRSVARRKLQAAKIKPEKSATKLKLYEQTPEVEALLEETGNPRMDEVKLREAEASARLKELKVDRESGRLVDFDEACEVFGKAIKGLYDRLKVDYPPKAGVRLHKLKTGRDVTAALRRDFDKIFGEFRADFRRFIR